MRNTDGETTTLLELSEFTPTGEVVEEGAAVGDGQVLLRWYCGTYVGAPVWRGDSYEPDECGTELYTLEDVGEVAEGQAQARCPSCGAELTQDYDSTRVES